MIPSVIDNQVHRLADVLRECLAQCPGGPFDAATAYFSISGYRLLQNELPQVGAFRLLIGSDPAAGEDIGLRPSAQAITRSLAGDLDAEPFTEETLRLVEQLIAFLRAEKVAVRHYEKGFLHAKAYLFHHDRVAGENLGDRLQPFAAIVGSSNFTGPGLTSNRELNLVHRVLLPADEAVDREAARSVEYLRRGDDSIRETILDPSGVDVPDAARRLIKSEVGARAVTDLMNWYERQWAEAVDFKDELIELLDSSKFGAREYTPYEIYIKALFEYFKEELGEDALALGRSAVELAEFQDDAVRKARRILQRYDGVLIADSVGLGKTWIGKKLLEDFAYHRRQKAVVVCPASLRDMWRRELASATIAAEVVGMEELGRDGFDTTRIGDADCVLVDESHNFRNNKSNRYLALDEAIQRNGGRGKDGERKKVILLSATPINNDLYDLASQIHLFTQNEADYFRDAGIGDLRVFFRNGRRMARQGAAAGVILFNLLEEIMVRNTRPFIRAAYPNATINGKPVAFPQRALHTVEYNLGATCGGLYADIVTKIEDLSLAPYQLETYRKPSEIRDEEEHKWEQGREVALVGINKTRFLKRLESSIHAFRESVRRALVFEETYLDYLLEHKVVSSRDFQKLMRFLSRDEEDDPAAGSVYDDLDDLQAARDYLGSLPSVDLNQYEVRKLVRDVEHDVAILKSLYKETEHLADRDGKLDRLKSLLAGELRGSKVLIFSMFKDTSRYLHSELASDSCAQWRASAGNPVIRRIDSGNHPEERGHILGLFAPESSGRQGQEGEPIDILISTDVLSEGQNLQDCGVIINYDLTWNPIRLVQRNGRIDRIGSPHAKIGIYNMFPEDELENLLHLIQRLTDRISTIDDLGLLDASVLGEIVHPRTFNTLRRIRDEDGAILDEEEARAELAGPEMMLKQLKELLNREGGERLVELPNGIHSGIRRQKCNGMFFYFQAPRMTGDGRRHFWRYIDAVTNQVLENRYEIAQLIACLPDEPRYIASQDVFALQDSVIEHIISTERDTAARAAAPVTVERIQQTIAEELKDALRRQTVDRELAKRCIRFLGEPMGRALHVKLRNAYDGWAAVRDDAVLLQAVADLADEFSKPKQSPATSTALQRNDLQLICFEYVNG